MRECIKDWNKKNPQVSRQKANSTVWGWLLEWRMERVLSSKLEGVSTI